MTTTDYTLADLGFSAHFMMQLDLDDLETYTPVRICEVQRSLLKAIGESGTDFVRTPSDRHTGDYCVGDWVLIDATGQIVRRLDPTSLLSRRSAGTHVAEQGIASNIDTLFIVSSCNADFNPARLERYLVLAEEARVTPVVILTKADLVEDTTSFEEQAARLLRNLPVLCVNATDPSALDHIRMWCGKGQTIAMVGSSGVGKTTLLNALIGTNLATRAIREDDAKGRHTTTSRSLHPMVGGGWIIDTPGMRALRLYDQADGIDAVFADITALAHSCRFNDCRHETEPGCAVQSAIEAGDLDPSRLVRWRKLQRENMYNSETIAESRKRGRDFSKMVSRVLSEQRGRKGC